ncbi:MAG: VOC family protein [Saprospiraceae bacterium]
MKLNHLRPMLWTRELKASIDYYTNILGFTCRDFNEDWGWASLHRDGVELMFATPNELIPFEKPVFTGSFYINTDNVDYWWEQLKDKVNLCYGIESFEYDMREFAFYDNNGYLIQFGQEIVAEE